VTSRRPVVVGVDGSPDASRALDLATDLARSIDAELVAVHALGLMAVVDGEHVPSFEHRDEIDRLLRDQWCVGLADAGVIYRVELLDGNPTEVLAHLAETLDPSFLVVGARGIGESADRELGSTSYHVTRHATCPVVVVPMPRIDT
jgi:nucleotide-binding universal stress UspA family protein